MGSTNDDLKFFIVMDEDTSDALDFSNLLAAVMHVFLSVCESDVKLFNEILPALIKGEDVVLGGIQYNLYSYGEFSDLD